MAPKHDYAYCTHEERNILLSHYVANVRSLSKKKIKTEQEKLVPVSGRSLRTYLNALMRGMKMYEKELVLLIFTGKTGHGQQVMTTIRFDLSMITQFLTKNSKVNRKIVHQPL